MQYGIEPVVCRGQEKKGGEVRMIWLFGDLSVIAFHWLRDRRTGTPATFPFSGKPVENMCNHVGKAAILVFGPGAALN